MNKKVKNLSLVLFFVYLFSFNVYADWLPLQLEETNEKDVFLMSMEETPGLELWHYSGGYWSDGVITNGKAFNYYRKVEGVNFN